MNRACATTLLLLAMMLPLGCGDAAPAGPAKGKANLVVTVVAKPKTGAKGFRSYKPSEADKVAATASTGDFELVDYEHLDGIVVWFEIPKATDGSLASTVKVAVKPKPDKVELLAVSLGDSVVFENKGSRRLRLYSVSERNEFDLGETAPGDIASHAFTSPGLVELLDGDAFDIIARIYVAPGRGARVVHPGTATTFRDLDPGAYRVVAWHERLPGAERDVMLTADGTRELDLLIGVNALPKVE
jgi:hypothetical protein